MATSFYRISDTLKKHVTIECLHKDFCADTTCSFNFMVVKMDFTSRKMIK